VIERIPGRVIAAASALAIAFAGWFAYSRPGYFTNQTYLAGVFFLEILVAAVFLYRRFFFPLTLVCFLFAGLNVDVGSGWTIARWMFLATGAAVGVAAVLKEQFHLFNRFHVYAAFAAMAALVSAAVSPFPKIALAKALSFFLLLVYAGSGVRLAVIGHEERFFNGLLTGCEVFVAALLALHLIGIEAMGNPNSLGAVMGVAVCPILLWGTLLACKKVERQRRLAACAVCFYLLFVSRSRAGLAAGVFSFVLLTMGLRRYKVLLAGVAAIFVVGASLAIVDPGLFFSKATNFANDVVYKGGDPQQGILLSRQTPWKVSIETISGHLWFGTGFGTTDTGKDASAHFNGVTSTTDVSTEHGSSYLAIASWVGVVGVIPFLFVLIALLVKAGRTLIWMFRTRNPLQPGIPLAIVVFAGLLHATFEDWLFAPGYYLCVYFWSMAFILADVAPSRSMSLVWRDTTDWSLAQTAPVNSLLVTSKANTP